MDQLLMYKTDGLDADDSLPEGYVFDTHREEYVQRWIDLMTEAIGGGWSVENFKKNMLSRAGIYPDGIFYIINEKSGIIASATGIAGEDGITGDLHMVAVSPGYRGKGLSFPLCARVINYLNGRGIKKIKLTTDDHRVPAIKTYLKLGFIPVLSDDTMAGRWNALSGRIPYLNAVEYFKKIPSI